MSDTSPTLPQLDAKLEALKARRADLLEKHSTVRRALDVSRNSTNRAALRAEVNGIEQTLAGVNAELRTLHQRRSTLMAETLLLVSPAAPVDEDAERKLAVQFACHALSGIANSAGHPATLSERAWMFSDAMMEGYLKRFAPEDAEQPTADNPAAR